MTAIRLPRKKAALLARVGRNALHPGVIMVVPASELIGKMQLLFSEHLFSLLHVLAHLILSTT